jgi:hypothetical protein
MEIQSTTIRVPSDLAQDVEEIVDAIKDAAEKEDQVADEVVKLARPRSKEMVLGGIDVLFLVVGTGATWFTKKWFDTFVWPELETRIRKPSTQAIDFVLKSLLAGETARRD